jgi:drug/metabolite transporter (DMT)-like permease
LEDKNRHLLEISVAMLFIGTSGMLGRFVPLEAGPAVWWRAALTIPLMVGYCWWRGIPLLVPKGRRWAVLLSGVLMAAHWVTYFYALKLSSVAIGMLAIFTYPAMTTLLEPLLLKKAFEPRHIGLAVLMLLGVYLLVPGEVSLADDAFVGLLFGLLSAFIYSLRNIVLKTQVYEVNGSVLMLAQVAVTVVLVAPFLFFSPALPTVAALPYLVGLALLTTAIGHTLFLRSFKHFSVSTASLLSCVQPVYGILLAMVFFGEVPGWSAVFGGGLILVGVVVEGWRVGLSARQ